MSRSLVFALALLCACAPQQIVTTVPFSEEQAKIINQSGKNSITGQAFIRQNGGGIVTCAGSKVALIPYSDYADDRLTKLYRSGFGGYRPLLPQIDSSNVDQRYFRFTREDVCDAQGNFTFNEIADGTYYLVARVIWTVGYSQEGGSLMKRIDLSGGKSEQVILTP